MSSPPRYFQNNIPYHIYNRGNRKGNIFLNVKDYQRFLKRIREYQRLFKIEILCYCLLPNHFHFILSQLEDGAITKFMLRVCTSYAKYFNIKYELVGRLFQERFRAKIVETDAYLLHLSRYIHLNPISDDLENLTQLRSTPGVERNEIRSRLRTYRWSSYNEYTYNQGVICKIDVILEYFSKTLPKLSYTSFVEGGIPEESTLLLKSFL